MIAMALSCSPKLLIADEPTTALDVTIQAQILDELRQLRADTNAGIILVTHDLGVVADIADRVVVMYAGRVVEQGTLDELFYDPQHPYTWGLLGSITRVDQRSRRAPAGDRRAAAVAAAPARGLPLPSPLPARVRPVLQGPRADLARARRARASRPLLAGARAQAQAAPGRRPIGLASRGGRALVSASTPVPGRSAGRRQRRTAARHRAPAGAVPDQVGADHRPPGRPGARRRRRVAVLARGRDARDRRRVGVRQDDPDPHPGAAHRADRRGDSLPRRGHHRRPTAAAWSRSGARCRWSSRTPRRR